VRKSEIANLWRRTRKKVPRHREYTNVSLFSLKSSQVAKGRVINVLFVQKNDELFVLVKSCSFLTALQQKNCYLELVFGSKVKITDVLFYKVANHFGSNTLSALFFCTVRFILLLLS
jgi:hypothetical protein